MNPKSIALSWLGFAVAELVVCPLHGVGKLLLWPLAALSPIVVQGCHATHEMLVGWAYALLTWQGAPPIPSLAYFRLQAQAVQVVHQCGTTLALGLLLAPFVKAWARQRWPSGG